MNFRSCGDFDARSIPEKFIPFRLPAHRERKNGRKLTKDEHMFIGILSLKFKSYFSHSNFEEKDRRISNAEETEKEIFTISRFQAKESKLFKPKGFDGF